MEIYTLFYLTNNKTLLVSKTLMIYEKMLSSFNFLRINRQDLININHVKEFHRQKKATIITTDDAVLNLSDTRKESFHNLMNQF